MDFITKTQYRQEIYDLWARINQHKPQLAERDKTILEQQAVIKGLRDCVHMLDKQYLESGIYDCNLSALEAALKAERIKTLEEEETYFTRSLFIGAEAARELRRMVNKLKEQS